MACAIPVAMSEGSRSSVLERSIVTTAIVALADTRGWTVNN